jgi:hypothetical protein
MLPDLLACFGPPVNTAVLPPGSCPQSSTPQNTLMLPHPSDCAIFYMCSNGVPTEMHCLPGLHFNNQLKRCDWQQNANCMKRKLSRLYLTLGFVFSSNNDGINLILTKVLLLLLLLSLALQPSALWLWPPRHTSSLDHTRHATVGRTPLDE